MDRPIYECIAYDLGNELEDLKKFKLDLEKYTDHLEEKLSKQLIIADVTPRFSVSLVYQNQTANMLRTLVTDANSKDEALGKAIQYFNKETDGFGLILKSVTHLNEG